MTNWLGAGDCGDVAASLPRYANGGRVPTPDYLADNVYCTYGIRLADYDERSRNLLLNRINTDRQWIWAT